MPIDPPLSYIVMVFGVFALGLMGDLTLHRHAPWVMLGLMSIWSAVLIASPDTSSVTHINALCGIAGALMALGFRTLVRRLLN